MMDSPWSLKSPIRKPRRFSLFAASLGFVRYHSPGPWVQPATSMPAVGPDAPASRWAVLRTAVALVVSFAVAFALLLGMAMHKHLDHDEHQFIASGALLARQGLLPYRDYPYFHMPNLVFVYAALDQFSDHLLTIARLFNVACAAVTLAIVFVLGLKWFGQFGPLKYAAAVIAVAAVASNPAVPHTSGRAWNHDLPILLTLLALLCLWRWRNADKPVARLAWAVGCGALYGLAAGTRLTFLQSGAAFVLAICVTTRQRRRDRLAAAVVFLLAAAVALIPTWWLLALAPGQFVFGNFVYPRLNTAYRLSHGFTKAMTPWGKAHFLLTDILNEPGNALLLIAVIGSLIALWRRRRSPELQPHALRFEIGSLGLVSASLFAGAFAATPLWLQYFFAPVPFAVLLVLATAADARLPHWPVRNAWKWLAIAAAVSVACILPAYWGGFSCLIHPSDWQPERLHVVGQEIALAAGHGRVLTYAPIAALEGGCEIYPQFATGSFAARVAPLLSDGEEQLMNEVDADDLDELVRRQRLDAVLVGLEDSELEQPLVSLAERRGFVAVNLPDPQNPRDHHTVWVRRGGE